jgi:hypothetical protein
MDFIAKMPAEARKTARKAALAAFAVLSAAAFGGGAAQAQSVAPTPAAPKPVTAPVGQANGAANGRFTMTPVANGFLRLDTRTGAVSLCTVASGQAECRASADERAALETEIGRLSKENAALKAQIAKDGGESQDERRFDHALDRMEKFMRRMIQLFRHSDKTPPTAL